MPQHLETKPTGSTTQMRRAEGFDVLKVQRTPSQYEEQRAFKRNHALEQSQAKQDVHSVPNETEERQKSAREIEVFRQELANRTLEIEALDKEYADLSIGEKAQITTPATEQDLLVIRENQKEAGQKETRFQEVRDEIKQTQQKLSETDQRIQVLETYQQALEQETQTFPDKLTTTHTLEKQVALLNTAITSLQEELNNKQLSSTKTEQIRQKIKDFSTQERDYQDQKAVHAQKEVQIPDIQAQLAKTHDDIQMREDELTEIDTRLKEIKDKRDSIHKEDIAPPRVSQNFEDQLTMAQDHVRYLEQKIEKREQEIRKTTMRTSDISRQHISPETAQPDEELTILNEKLGAEQKYVDDLLAEKVERANSNRDIHRYIDDELKVTRTEIAAFKKINDLFHKEKDILQRIDPHDRMNMQSKIELHLKQNENFLHSSITYKHEIEDLLDGNQPTPASLDAQRHGIYTAQNQEGKRDPAIILLPISLQKEITRRKIGLMDEQLETIGQLLNGQRSAEAGYLQKLQRECIGQRQAGNDYHDNLEKDDKLYVTKAIVNRPLNEQLTMVQNLVQMYEQDTSQPERLLKQTAYQQTLKMLDMRQQQITRTSGERLNKQIEMVEDHKSFLQLESQDAKNVQDRFKAEVEKLQANNHEGDKADNETRIKELQDQITELQTKQDTLRQNFNTEQEYLEKLKELDNAKIRSQPIITRNAKDQITMFNNLIKYLDSKHTHAQRMLQQSQQNKSKLEQSIQNLSGDQVQIHPKRESQRELVERNLQYLRQKSQQYTEDIQEKEKQKSTLSARLIHLSKCNDMLTRDSLSNKDVTSDNAHLWKSHKNSLRAEIQQLQQDSSPQNKFLLHIQQERLRQAELLDKYAQQERDIVRPSPLIQKDRAFTYTDQLDLQRDHLRHMQEKIAALAKKNGQRFNDHISTIQEVSPFNERKKSHAFDKKADALYKQWDESIQMIRKITTQLENITTNIRHTHEFLKVLAEKQNENKHPFFLNEHMLFQDSLIKFDVALLSPLHVFMGTDESMCVPSSVRMICYDHDPSFAMKAKEKEVNDALNIDGNGGARITDIPQALKKLGHPFTYEPVGVDSIHQLINRIKSDQFGKPLPFILNIERYDKPESAKHTLVCHRIIELNGHHYAILRDPLMLNAFSIRLEHLDEVLMQTEINAVIPV